MVKKGRFLVSEKTLADVEAAGAQYNWSELANRSDWALYKNRPLVIMAVRSGRWATVPTLDGPQEINPGDWLLRTPGNGYFILDADDFAMTYEEA